jgi:hypothetical protein
MEHRGVEYRIIQGIKPGDWKWSVLSEAAGRKSGTSDTKDAAVSAAARSTTHSIPKNGSSVRQHDPAGCEKPRLMGITERGKSCVQCGSAGRGRRRSDPTTGFAGNNYPMGRATDDELGPQDASHSPLIRRLPHHRPGQNNEPAGFPWPSPRTDKAARLA